MVEKLTYTFIYEIFRIAITVKHIFIFSTSSQIISYELQIFVASIQ